MGACIKLMAQLSLMVRKLWQQQSKLLYFENSAWEHASN
jgi:hypothetical protein